MRAGEQQGVAYSEHLLRGTTGEAETWSLLLATVQPEDRVLFAYL